MKGNRVQLIGYVGQHLENRNLDNGGKRTAIRLATHYGFRKKNGEWVDHTVWHNVVAWDNQASFAERSFVKGSKIMVEGFIEYRTYVDKTGQIKYQTRITAQSLMNLDR